MSTENYRHVSRVLNEALRGKVIQGLVIPLAGEEYANIVIRTDDNVVSISQDVENWVVRVTDRTKPAVLPPIEEVPVEVAYKAVYFNWYLTYCKVNDKVPKTFEHYYRTEPLHSIICLLYTSDAADEL